MTMCFYATVHATIVHAESNKAFISEIFTCDWALVYKYSIYTRVLSELDCSLEQGQDKC